MKRLIDIFLAASLLPVFAPLMALFTVSIYLFDGRPILFTQKRVGLDGREFQLRKFRSMRNAHDCRGHLLADEQRVTAFGRILRRTRFDELPELVQVLTGDLSLVGPRPLPRTVVESDRFGRYRLGARPGLTGLAQVSGNTLLTNSEKFAIDAYYVSERSLAMDLGIIFRTVLVVLFGERRDEELIEKAMAYANGLDRGG